MTELKKATSLEEFRNSFRLRPLAIEEMSFRQDTAKSRGESPNTLKSLKRNWRHEDNTEYDHVLFIGYKGCGKSTELNYFQKEMEDQYLVINFSVYKELNPLNVSHIELFMVMMEKMFQVASDKNMEINDAFLKKIHHWLASKEVVEITERHLGAELITGVEGSVQLPFLLKFFGSFKAAARANRQFKETLKTTLEPRLQDLVNLCNDLIREVRRNLYRVHKKDLIFILEEMDKVNIKTVEEIFYNYSVQLTEIQAKTIFTYPLSLYYYGRFAQIRGYFSHQIELPMIKTFEKDAITRNDEGFEALQKMIQSRTEMHLINMDVDKFIEKCGGCIRDLFLMLITAAENALNYDRDTIIDTDFTAAYKALKKDYEAGIAEYREEFVTKDGQSEIYRYYPKEFYEDLAMLAKSPDKKPENTQRILILRQNLSILGYNGEGWCNVHPILQDTLREKGLL